MPGDHAASDALRAARYHRVARLAPGGSHALRAPARCPGRGEPWPDGLHHRRRRALRSRRRDRSDDQTAPAGVSVHRLVERARDPRRHGLPAAASGPAPEAAPRLHAVYDGAFRRTQRRACRRDAGDARPRSDRARDARSGVRPTAATRARLEDARDGLRRRVPRRGHRYRWLARLPASGGRLLASRGTRDHRQRERRRRRAPRRRLA